MGNHYIYPNNDMVALLFIIMPGMGEIVSMKT